MSPAIWVLVAHNNRENRSAVWLINVPIHSETVAIQVYADWRLRGKIEHGYRFDQEQGLDVEEQRVHTLERMRRLFALVLAVAQFVFHLMRLGRAKPCFGCESWVANSA